MVSEVTTCRRCGKPILFVEMQSGKRMPCSAKMYKVYLCEGDKHAGLFVLPQGKLVRGRTDALESVRTVTAYLPHWGECTGVEPKPKKKEMPGSDRRGGIPRDKRETESAQGSAKRACAERGATSERAELPREGEWSIAKEEATWVQESLFPPVRPR